MRILSMVLICTWVLGFNTAVQGADTPSAEEVELFDESSSEDEHAELTDAQQQYLSERMISIAQAQLIRGLWAKSLSPALASFLLSNPAALCAALSSQASVERGMDELLLADGIRFGLSNLPEGRLMNWVSFMSEAGMKNSQLTLIETPLSQMDKLVDEDGTICPTAAGFELTRLSLFRFEAVPQYLFGIDGQMKLYRFSSSFRNKAGKRIATFEPLKGLIATDAEFNLLSSGIPQRVVFAENASE